MCTSPRTNSGLRGAACCTGRLHYSAVVFRRLLSSSVLAPTFLCKVGRAALLAPFDEGVSAGRTSVITALAHGLPVVTTAGPAAEDIWKNTEGVILVNRDPGDLADALMRLHLDENYWEKTSKEARAFYLAHFEWDKILDQAYPEFMQAKAIKPHFQAASLKSR